MAVICCAMLAATSALRAGDVLLYLAIKGQFFTQTDANPSLSTNDPFIFRAFVEGADSDLVRSVTIQVPGAPAPVSLEGNGDRRYYDFFEGFTSLSLLNERYPMGVYQWMFDTAHDPATTAALSLGPEEYPSTPGVLGYSAAQRINPATSFTLTWTAFTNGTEADFIQLRLWDEFGDLVYDTGDLYDLIQLSGTNTSTTLPPYTLDFDSQYGAELVFVKVTDRETNAYPSVMGAAGYFKVNHFQIQTLPQPEIVDYGLIKGQVFVQTNANIPTLRTNRPYYFRGFVEVFDFDFATNVTLRLPTAGVSTLIQDDWTGTFELQQNFTNLAALNQVYGTGTYTFRVDTVTDGRVNLPITLTTGSYPSTPQVSNFATTQAIDPTNDFVLTWEPFVGGRSNDYIQLDIVDEFGSVFATPPFGDPDALNGTSTSAMIPAFGLPDASSYNARLLFVRVTTATTNTAGVVGFAGYAKQTRFLITTIDVDYPAWIDQPTVTNSLMQFEVWGDPGIRYRLEVSQDLTNWTTLLITNAPENGYFEIRDTVALGNRFYRVVTLR